MTDEEILQFVDDHPDAAMITLRADGTAHMARVEIAVVDGHIRSSGSPRLMRTRNLRRDPRCSLFVFGPHPHWLGLETEATMLDGPDAPEQLVQLMRARHKDAAPPGMVLAHDDQLGHDRPYEVHELIEQVRRDGRFVYDFRILKSYGNL
jgi:Pyridoxamine 5'-phosphate oxidase